jgi:class 3 adenylate cyclase
MAEKPSIPGANLDYKQIFQSLSQAIAVIDTVTHTVIYENAIFFDWFSPDDDEKGAISDRLPDLKMDRLMSRIEEGRSFRLETEVKIKSRDVPVRVTFRPVEIEGQPYILAEASDITKEKESQYMLESYSRLAEKNTKRLESEKNRVERLLLNIMPKSIYEELKDSGVTSPQRFEGATILMLDFVKFTDMTISHDPSALVSELNDIFSSFDRIVENFSGERIRTIGDSYMCACGLPEENEDHAKNMAKVALRIRRYLDRRNNAHPQEWRCRMGLNSGSVIGSLVGIQKYVYDLFGPGVNLAARMESLSEPMHITTNQTTYDLLKDDFVFSERGEHDVRGFGKMNLYYLESELPR